MTATATVARSRTCTMYGEALVRIIGDIYEAALDPSIWPRCLTAISDLVGGTTATLLSHDHTTGTGAIVAMVRISPEARAAYLSRFCKLDPWATSRKFGAVAPGNVVAGTELVDYSDLRRTEFFAFYRRHDITRLLAGVLAPAPRSAVISVNRAHHHARFGRDEARVLEALMPHVRRSLAVHHQVSKELEQTQVALEVFDSSDTGVIALGADGTVLHANRSARACAGVKGPLVLSSGGVSGTTCVASAMVRAEISRALSLRADRHVPAAPALLPRATGSPLQIVAIPLGAGAERLGLPACRALLIVRDPDRPPRACAEALLARFGFSPTEARFAAGLASGCASVEVADSMHLTESSRRWIVERVRQKTGSRTQAQAVTRLVTTVARQRSAFDSGENSGWA